MDGEKVSSINQLRTRFPALSFSDARALLERHNWNVVIATAAADHAEAERAKSSANSYFVGGGDKGSGQQVLAPPNKDCRNKGDVHSLIGSIFQKAKEEGENSGNGAEEGDGGERTFYGRGQRLGYTTSPSPFIASTVRAERSVRVTVYSNGFVVDDDSFIPLDGAEGRQFVEAMDRGHVPATLAARYPNTDLTVNLLDCMQVEYTPPAYTAFQGAGHRLTSTTAPPAASGAVPAVTSSTSSDPARKVEVHEDEEKSFVLLLNTRGERKQFPVNPARHTVEDLYSLAHAYQPEVARLVLVERGMPPRRMEDAMRPQTIAAAKLTRAVLAIQPL